MARLFAALLSLITLSSCIPNENLGSNQAVLSTRDWELATKKAVKKYGKQAKKTLMPLFQQASLAYPPKDITLLAFKEQKKIELWVKDANHSRWQYVKSYPLTAFSGRMGPKLAEYDKQIPEGFYRITWLNPFSSQHLSMKLNYPNAFDRHQALLEGRTGLGDNIFIHGKELSVGCLAIGDTAIDELFVLVAESGKENVEVIIAPTDFRVKPLSQPPKQKWLYKLYAQLKSKLSRYT